MNWFDKIKSYYERNLWTKEQVKVAVEKGKITEEEYELIIATSRI